MTGASALTLDPTTGYLPRGRHRVSEADVQARFVSHAEFTASTTRAEVWEQYELGRDLLASKVRIHAVWIGGSFLTSKVNANDLDALFIVSGRDYVRQDTNGKKVVDSFRPVPVPGQKKPVRRHGLDKLDSFILMWSAVSPLDPGTPSHAEYAVSRGYWDDFWQRDRYNKPDGVPRTWRDAIPVRGYLEVELDDFTR